MAKLVIKRVKEYITNYFRLLKKNYLRDILIVPATLISMIIGFSKNPTWDWEFVPITLLIGYFYLALYYNFISTKQVSIAINAGYTICLNKDTIKFRDALMKQIETLEDAEIGIDRVTDYYKILAPDWQYYYPLQIIPNEWHSLIDDITKHYIQFALKLPTKTHFHLFLIAPPAIAFGLGYTLGRNRAWSIYHLSGSNYVRLFCVENSIGENGKSTFDYIEVIDENWQEHDEIVLVLSIIPKPNTPLPKISGQYIEIRPKNSTARVPVEQINPIGTEIITAMDKYLKTGKKIHLFPGVPVPLAFFIGRALIESAPILVYNHNYETESWECVFSITDLD